MTWIIAIAVLVSLLSVAATVAYTRASLFVSTGGLTMMMLVTYHVVPEILNGIFPNRNDYRTYLPLESSEHAAIIAAIGIVCFCVGYAIFFRRPVASRAAITQGLGERLPPLTWLLPIAVICIIGQLTSSDADETSGSVSQLIAFSTVPVVWLIMIRLCSRRKRYAELVPPLGIVLLVAIYSTTASRWKIAFITIETLALVYYSGFRLRRITYIGVGATVAAYILVVTLTRAQVGYEMFRSGSTSESASRYTVYKQMVWSRGAVLDNFVYRFDGNSSIGHMDAEFSTHDIGPQFTEVAARLLLLPIPRAIYRNKPGQGEEFLIREKAFFTVTFGLPATDNIITILGSVFGMFGRFGYVVCCLVWGAGIACCDNRLLRSGAVVALIGFLWLYWSVLMFEFGVEAYVMNLRNLLPLAALVLLYARYSSKYSRRSAVPLIGSEAGRQSVAGSIERRG